MVDRFQISEEASSWWPVLAFIAFFGALWRLPYWSYPANLTKPNGEPDPRAGKFSLWKMVTELVIIPLLVMGGVLALDQGVRLALVLGADAAFAVLGTAFFYELVNRIRDIVIPAIGAFISKWLGVGK